MDIFFNTLPQASAEIWPKLKSFRQDFYLAGGTALALQLGHRRSADFDLFSNRPIKKNLLKIAEESLESPDSHVLVNNSDEFSLIVHGVKITFLYYPFELLQPLLQTDVVDLLSAQEILVTKAYTIGRRGSFKDYVDLFTGLKKGIVSLDDLMKQADQKYGDSFNSRLFLEQLIYLDDLVGEDLVMHDTELPDCSTLQAFFEGEISKIKL